jgi:chemotaxis protein CheZ
MTDSSALSRDEAFDKLGQITRQLHQAMTELGVDVHLHRIAHEIPDARDRLSYVGQMTETAAHKVLGLVEQARPGCAHLGEHALGQRRDLARIIADTAAPEAQLRESLRQADQFAGAVVSQAAAQESVLGEIMMTQDFQDLSGQVIKKVIDIISRTESQLLQLLTQTAPEHIAAAAAASSEHLQGPQTPDKALKQDDVDDLLASMGF